MTKINPYLTFIGNCEEAFNHYKSIFGGEFTYVGRFDEMPPNPENPMSDEDKTKIMHMSLPISDETVLMGSDALGELADQTIIGSNISLSINADTKEDANKIFEALATGGKITMPITDSFWGDYFGMCTDKFEINWMVSFNEYAKEA